MCPLWAQRKCSPGLIDAPRLARTVGGMAHKLNFCTCDRPCPAEALQRWLVPYERQPRRSSRLSRYSWSAQAQGSNHGYWELYLRWIAGKTGPTEEQDR